jgi:GTPase
MIDNIKLKIKAGKCGDGAVSFWREKFIPKGGPDGGDGGKGGDVYFIVDTGMSTLMDFRSKKIYQAEDGADGMGRKMYGRKGFDLHMKLPLGTLVYDVYNDEKRLVADLNSAEATFLAAKGGKGGKGNVHFKSSTNRTPEQYTPGGDGEEKDYILEVKMIADLGLIGLPNAGKSTLINHITDSQAKVANYKFTTLVPNLGVWEVERDRKIVVADIPGLVEGASLGKGLGEDFLRHIERTKILVHIIDPLGEAYDLSPKRVFEDYKAIRKELADYKTGLWGVDEKAELVVINKVDITEVHEAFESIRKFFLKKGIKVLGISAVTGEGLEDLRKEVLRSLQNYTQNYVATQASEFDVKKPIKRYNALNLPKSAKVLERSTKRDE